MGWMMRLRILLFISVGLAMMPVYGQGSAPTPGAVSNYGSPVGGAPSYSAGQYTGAAQPYAGASSPLPGSSAVYQTRAAGASDKASIYQMLPISIDDAKLRIEEMRNLVAVSRPQDVQDRVNALCEWLADMTEAHNRLGNVFSKQDSLKAQAAVEKNTAQKFAHLKNEAVLLKADVLIKQNRIPEAIAPLVDIVSNEPKGSAGVAAYNRLKEIGFSVEPPQDAAPSVSSTPPVKAPPSSAGPVMGHTLAVSATRVPAKPIQIQSNRKAVPATSSNRFFIH
jgi:hypothetical protein